MTISPHPGPPPQAGEGERRLLLFWGLLGVFAALRECAFSGFRFSPRLCVSARDWIGFFNPGCAALTRATGLPRFLCASASLRENRLFSIFRPQCRRPWRRPTHWNCCAAGVVSG